MKIKVLGTGCPKCKKLYAEVEAAIAEAGIAVDLEKVDQIGEITKYAVMMTPAIVIDEAVKASGRVPPRAEIVGWIKAGSANGRA